MYVVMLFGDNVWLGPNVSILTVFHPMGFEDRRVDYYQDSFEPEKRGNKEHVAPVTIGDDVWIAAGVVICSGVKIGNRTVIGAGIVVTGIFPMMYLLVEFLQG